MDESNAPGGKPGQDSRPERIPGRVRPGDLAIGYRAAASVIRSAQNHIEELDTCDLGLPSGQVIRIVTVSEVEDWLNRLAQRIAAGEVL